MSAALAPLAVHAEGGEEFKLLANVNVVHDSNLFRLSRDTDVQARLGRSSPAETITTSALGVRYDKSYSLQRVFLEAIYSRSDYQSFSYLNYNALNYRALWDWSYTPHFRGTISTSRNQALNSFLDFRGFNQRNERIDRNTRFDATYDLDARWRIDGGISFNKRKNELPIVQEADFDNRAVDLGLRYVLPSGSSASYTLRRTSGDLLNRPFPSAGLNDKAYRQTDQTVQATWAITDKTSAVFRLGHKSRTHPNYPQRDFDGLTGSANVNWSLSAKTAFSASLSTDIDAYETANTNYRRINRVSMGPSWQLGTKTTMRLQLGHEVFEYDGSPGVRPPSERRDNLTNASLSLGWQPFRFMSVNASIQNARRSANQPGLDFDANIVNLSAQFSF